MVLELGNGLASAHAGRLLIALGASVTKALSVSSPGGDVSYLDEEKEVMALDPDDGSANRRLETLLTRADVVIRQCDGAAVDVGPFSLAGTRRSHPRLITAAITPFGESGPHRDHQITDLVALQGGGLGYGTPPRVTDPAKENPLGIPGDVVQALAGLVAVLGIQHALLERDADGHGRHVEVSQQETVASLMLNNIATYIDSGISPSRLAADRPGARRQFLPAADGMLVMMANRPHHFRAWLELLGEPGNALIARLNAGEPQAQVVQDSAPVSDAWTRARTRREVTELAQARHIPVEPVLRPAEVLQCPQLEQRRFWQVGPGGLRLAGHPFGPLDGAGPRHAPSLAPVLRNGGSWAGFEATEGPLAGLRVLDFTWVLAGPIATRILAVLGATVIKVESPGAAPDGRGQFFMRTLQGGKHATRFDLKDDADRSTVERLAREADVIVENFSTGVMERFGLGWDGLHVANPGLVMLSISGMGRTGPYAHHVMLGQLAQAYSGLTSLVGYEDGSPRGIEDGGFWSDPVTGYAGVAAVLAALRERAITGRGRRLDISLLEATAATLFDPLLKAARGVVRRPMGNFDARMAPHDTYRCAPEGEDRWFALAVRTDEEWRSFCAMIGRPELADDRRFSQVDGRLANRHLLRDVVETWSRQQTAEQSSAACQAAGIPAAPCRSSADLVADEHLRARRFFIEGPEGQAPPWCLALPWRTHPESGLAYRPSASPGEHTASVRMAVAKAH